MNNKNKRLNLLIFLDLVVLLVSGSVILYQQNIGNFKQFIAIKCRQKMSYNNTPTTPQKIDGIAEGVIDNTTDFTKLGEIAIPKLGILLPIYNRPYDQTALNKGAQQMPTNSGDIDTLGHGNLVIVGHNYNDGHSDFSALQEYINNNQPYLKNNQCHINNWINGQKIYIATSQKIFEYSISKQYLIKEDNTDVLNDSNDAQINLITCLEPNDQYRIITTGTLEAQWDWKTAPVSIINYFNHQKFKYNLKVGA
ncbi:class A sortase [Ligilactobacillus sp. LYQ135]